MASLEKMAPRQYFSHAGLMQILRIHLNCRGDQAKRLYIIGLALPKCIGHGWAIWEGKGLVGTGVGIRYPAPTLARGGEGTGSGSSGLGCDRPDLAQERSPPIPEQQNFCPIRKRWHEKEEFCYAKGQSTKGMAGIGPKPTGFGLQNPPSDPLPNPLQSQESRVNGCDTQTHSITQNP